MDTELCCEIDGLIAVLQNSHDNTEDPVARLMVNSLVYQARKLRDDVAALPEKILERLYSGFIPRSKMAAMPALVMLQPVVRARKDVEPHQLSDATQFIYKVDSRRSMSYYPLFRNTIFPIERINLLEENLLKIGNQELEISGGEKGRIWIGLQMRDEVESLEGLSIMLKGTDGLRPSAVYLEDGTELGFEYADTISGIQMAAPYDSEQTDAGFVEMMHHLRGLMRNRDQGVLLYITDPIRDRDLFRSRQFPKSFQQVLESEILDRFEQNILWLRLEFGRDVRINNIEVIPNVVPAANLNIQGVTLTNTTPIASLEKDKSAYFIGLLETPLSNQKQGFSTVADEVMIRDFDSRSYDPADLRRDVRNLYNRFIDDYQAFIQYYALKDGELLKSLREVVNRIGKSVENIGDQEDKSRGVYLFRRLGVSNASTIKVSYLTTNGRLGNTPRAGMVMENRKDAALEKDVRIISDADGGEDRPSADTKYEMLRYFMLTADRLYTKMDIEAFMRMQIAKEFGTEESRRISIEVSVAGTGGKHGLQRGLYVILNFKDTKNYQKALDLSLDKKLKRLIEEKSCLSMPLIIKIQESHGNT